MTILDRVKKIGEKWFLMEPLLFATYCSHELVINESISVPVRTGNGRIELSPKILEKVDDSILQELLKVEMYRILLKHPYQRQPPFAIRELLTLASNVTINDVNGIAKNIKSMMSGAELKLPQGLYFEEYYALLKENAPRCKAGKDEGDGKENGSRYGNGDENGNGVKNENADSQISELWEENEELCCDINSIIEVTSASDSWGSVPGSLQGIIKASLKVDMDYRKMLSLFKTSVISNRRRLTRMRPNRRFGFNAMGSRYELTTNLLIAVDVSGSVTDESLTFFFSIINRLFKYGVQKIDVLQFDTEIKGKPELLKKVQKEIKIIGRGGTDFQPVADFYCEHPEYDGLIIFTDGYAPSPTYNTKRPIDVLWVLCGKAAYEDNHIWIKNLKRNRVTCIPGVK